MAKQGTSKAAAAARRATFVEAYLAKAAGYPNRSARSRGHELVKDRDISAAIDKRRTELARKYELTTDDVIRSLAQVLHFDPAKLYDEHGNIKPITEMDEDTRMALASLDIVEVEGSDKRPGRTMTRIRWAEKNTAREQAIKHLGLYERDNKQTADPLTALLDRIAERGKFLPPDQGKKL
jgi:phage terminase small subunit